MTHEAFAPETPDVQVTPILGYVLYAEKFDVVYRGHIYERKEDAEKALASVVWHNRPSYAIRPVTIIGWRNVP